MAELFGNLIEVTYLADPLLGSPEEVFEDQPEITSDDFVDYRYRFSDGVYLIHMIIWVDADDYDEQKSNFYLKETLLAFSGNIWINFFDDTQRAFFRQWLQSLD